MYVGIKVRTVASYVKIKEKSIYDAAVQGQRRNSMEKRASTAKQISRLLVFYKS